MASPELASEGTKAGAVVGIFLTILHFFERMLRRGDAQRHAALEEIDKAWEINAEQREDQRKVIESQRAEIGELKTQLSGLEKELRAWRRGERTPRINGRRPPENPPE